MKKITEYLKFLEGRSIWLLWLLIVGFFIGKYSDLFLPFFWDELGVYGPGILYMVDHGMGMLPSSLPPELSRGHPLFFYFLFAAYIKVIGFSLLKVHLLSFSITVGLVIATWYVGKQTLNEWMGLLAAGMLMVMPNVFSLAAMVLPESIIALSSLLSLYFFHEKKMGWYFLSCTIGLMTKESALIIPLAVACFSIVSTPHRSVKNILLGLSPLLIYAAFLGIQKVQNGWYFFPYHVQFISYKPAKLLHRLATSFFLLGEYQGRTPLKWAIVTGVIPFIYQTWKNRKVSVPSFLLLSIIFFIGILCFTALNVYMDRYLLVLLPLLALGLGFAINGWMNWLPKWKWIPATLAIVIALYPLTQFTTLIFRIDQDINFRDVVSVQIQATQFIEEHIEPGEEFYANFPLYNGFLDPRHGFLQKQDSLAAWVVMNDSMRWAAVIEPPIGSIRPLKIDPAKIVTTFEQGCSKAVIYRLRE